jgi:exonuclease III
MLRPSLNRDRPATPSNRPTTSTPFKLATLNLHGLRTQSKLDLLLDFLSTQSIDILLGQETHHDDATDLVLPDSWTWLRAPNPLIPGRRGLMIMVCSGAYQLRARY